MKRILQLDGGGVKGVMQAYWLAYIEAKTKKPIHEIFDLIVGTSIGAIIGAMLADGVKAETVYNEMINILPKIFKKRFRMPLFQPKYDRKISQKFINKYVAGHLMKTTLCDLMVTSVNMVDGKNHFFKSWEQKDGALEIQDVVARSYAAPMFFGGIVDKENKAVWLDGGTGNMNCPLDYAIIEPFRQGWVRREDRVFVLSLGTGSHKIGVPWYKAKKSRNVKQVSFFIDPQDGGLAREQATNSKIALSNCMSKKIKGFGVKRIDVTIPAKFDKLDGVKYIDNYINIASSVKNEIPMDKLI